MFKSKVRQSSLFYSGLTALFWTCFSGCASIGSPGGGLYDETPPVLRDSDPADGATHVKKRKITMHFDENIKLDNALEKLTVSPPQEKSPIILSNAKTLSIELLDSLKANTTYSIDLGDAVQDNNEGNPMEGLSLSFSTGDAIDSLQFCGYLLNAANLEPITGAYVGIYDESRNTVGDSVLLNRTMERAGKTDAYGAFRILGCAPGRYRMFALIDGNSNFRYDLASEDIAFSDTLVTPTQDTTRLLMLAFNEGRLTRYMEDCTRPDSIHVNVRFAAQMDTLPDVRVLLGDGQSLPGDSVLMVQANPTRDTLTYWIRDSLFYQADTLTLSLTYLHTDTAGIDVPRTDTLQLLRPVQRPQIKEEDKNNEKRLSLRRKKGKKDSNKNDTVSAPQITYMNLRQIAGQHLGIGAKPRFETSAPLRDIELSGVHLQQKQDTLWKDLRFELVPDSMHPCRYTLLALPHYAPGMSYQLLVDSAAMTDIYGHPIEATRIPFKEKTNEEYAHLLFNIEGVEEQAFVELLDSHDRVAQRAKVINRQAKFVHVSPGTYYARIVIDANRNGRFDTGSLFEHRQPERVYYFNVPLALRANWTIQQTWNPTELPLVRQKPDAVKSNKPKAKRERVSRNEEYLRRMGKK